MIDLHSHLDLYPEALKMLPEVARRNIFTLVVTTSPRAWEATSRMFAGYENIKVGLGLHPEIVDRKASELNVLVSSIVKAKFIGEIGLDGSPKFRESLPLQETILTSVFAECEKQGGRILSIHSRGAASRVLDLLKKYPRVGKPVLHWFSGTTSEIHQAINQGCWFSVGPTMLTSLKGRDLLKIMPMDKVLPETDGPFATREGVPLMPWEACDIIPELGRTWRLSTNQVQAQLHTNLQALLQ